MDVRTNVVKQSVPEVTKNVQMTILADRLKAVFFVRKITNLAEFGRRVGVTRATVGDWLHGRTAELKGDKLFDVARELGVTPEWLARGSPSRVKWVEPKGSTPSTPTPTTGVLVESCGRLIPVIPMNAEPSAFMESYMSTDEKQREKLTTHRPNFGGVGSKGFIWKVPNEAMDDGTNTAIPCGVEAFIDPESSIDYGDIVLVSLSNKQAILRRYDCGDGTPVLTAFNNRWPSPTHQLLADGDQVLGAMTGYYKPIKGA
ncbi:hypothetical protein CCP3SC1_70038 [Gammaproteobacteria bacterium]